MRAPGSVLEPPAMTTGPRVGATAAPPGVDAARRYATLTFLRGALVALGVTVLAGVVAVLFYLPAAAGMLMEGGLSFSVLRPVHTTFASAWIFLGGVAVVHRYLEEHAGPAGPAERTRLVAQVLLWMIAGAGILLTLAGGITSGREYMGFHPAFSLAILAGWLLFAWNFFRATWRGFWHRPVYVTMWGVGVLFFIYTFCEQHLWLLPGVFDDPVVDLRVQWKATGTLVGSFNLFVYGALYFVAEKLTGDERYAHSKLAYALFTIGLLNSFTNFGHHTYHVPQNAVVHWVSFVVSMLELLILARVLWDIARAVRTARPRSFDLTRLFLSAAKWWTAAMFFGAVLLSVPPLNAIVHGTQVVTGHAMGTEIGIDTMALFAAVAWLLLERAGTRSRGNPAAPPAAIGLNVAAAALVVWLHVSGAAVGFTRYLELPPPDWISLVSPAAFVTAGILTATCAAILLVMWLGAAFARFDRNEHA